MIEIFADRCESVTLCPNLYVHYRHYCYYLFGNGFARELKSLVRCARSGARGICIMRRIIYALGRAFFFFFASHEKGRRNDDSPWRPRRKNYAEAMYLVDRYCTSQKSPGKLRAEAARIACRKEREFGCIAMHEIPFYDEKRAGYASLRIAILISAFRAE